MKIKTIYDWIDEIAPFSTAEKWDNVGLLIGDINGDFTKALLALNITNEVVEEAHEINAQLIISHHPVIFVPMQEVTATSPVYQAARYGISCISAHTNLDKSEVFGVNLSLANAMKLNNISRDPENELLFIGYTESPCTSDEFMTSIKKNLDLPGVCYTRFNNNIKKIGMCSGGGGSEIYDAIKTGCDAFVTGEIKHHELIEANSSGISTFILGHFESEDVVIKDLTKRLSAEFPTVDFIKSKTCGDGVVFG